MDITTVSRLDMTAVRQTITEVLKLPSDRVIDAESETDVSSFNYFVTVFDSFSSEIGNERKFDAENELEIITASKEVTISVNAYGGNARAVIDKLVTSVRFYQTSRLFYKIGLAFVSASQIRSLPAAISGGKEQRAQVDLIFSHIHRLKTELQRGESVDIPYKKG